MLYLSLWPAVPWVTLVTAVGWKPNLNWQPATVLLVAPVELKPAVTVLPDFFTGGPDQLWLDWVEDFDLHGDINGWTPEQRRQFLPIRLKGGPRDTPVTDNGTKVILRHPESHTDVSV